MGKRIWQYPEVTSLAEDDYLLLGNPTDGSRAILGSKIAPKLMNKTVTERKTYKASEETGDYNGYSQVTVDVPYTNINIADGADATWNNGEDLQLKSLTADIDSASNKCVAFVSSTAKIYNTAPYLYRQSPDAGNVYFDGIAGGSVAWNQLYNIPSSASSGGIEMSFTDGVMSFSGETTAGYFSLFRASIQGGHKILVSANVISNPNNLNFTFGSLNGQGNIRVTGTGIFTSVTNALTISYNTEIGFESFGGSETNFNGLKMKCFAIDLTLAFGSTIADAIYTMEQSTVGSGIAWLRSYGFMTKSYYAYDGGSLQSVNVASRKVVGFNQWDEVREYGRISTTDGQNANVSGTRSKNYIKVLPSTTYYVKATENLFIIEYDESKAFVRYANYFKDETYTTSASCRYIRFYSTVANLTTDICLNISDPSKNGTYEPYTLTTYPLDSSLTLRGIPKLSNSNLYYDGDTYASDGSVKRKYGVVDLGTLTYSYAEGIFSTNISLMNTLTAYKVICSKYPYGVNNFAWASVASYADKTVNTTNNSYLYIKDSTYTDAATFKTAMDGVYLVYELATPTTESATPYTNPQLVGSTEEFVDAGTSASTPTRDVDIPVGNESYYYTGSYYETDFEASGSPITVSNGTIDMVSGLLTDSDSSQTYQLEGHNIHSLVGTNHVFANTGDVDVEYQTTWTRPTT